MLSCITRIWWVIHCLFLSLNLKTSKETSLNLYCYFFKKVLIDYFLILLRCSTWVSYFWNILCYFSLWCISGDNVSNEAISFSPLFLPWHRKKLNNSVRLKELILKWSRTWAHQSLDRRWLVCHGTDKLNCSEEERWDPLSDSWSGTSVVQKTTGACFTFQSL